jgi:hypothetical protein
VSRGFLCPGGDKIGEMSQTLRREILMGTASRYWRLIRLDGRGRRIVEVIEEAQTFFRQQFVSPDSQVQDVQIQQRLLELLHDASHQQTSQMAQFCLRCFISSQIEQVCLELEAQFGREHGFTRDDLFPFVLSDRIENQFLTRQPSAYKSLATEILETFTPGRSSLSTWTKQLVKHQTELNRFLLERGVYLLSDWAILNDTKPKQLQKILTQFYNLAAGEVQQAATLLEGYHAIYRQDRLKLRQSGGGGRCLPPTQMQLEQIVGYLREKTNLSLYPDAILIKLQKLAEKLRQYRIHARGGASKIESLDLPENRLIAANIPSPAANDDESEDLAEFLQFYRASFLECLDRAVEKVLSGRISILQSKKPPKTSQFLQALHLFHCQGNSMGEIADQVGLAAQYQVTRLLKLKEFRADIRQHMLNFLRSSVMEKAAIYVKPERLKRLETEVESALDERIAEVMQKAIDEASVAKNRPLTSLFSQRLCQHLDLI